MIERTAKKWKAQKVLSTVLSLVGGIMLIVALNAEEQPNSQVGVGALLLAIGAVWRLYVSCMIWWHHD